MKKIVVEGVTYYQVEVIFNVDGVEKKTSFYTVDPQNIDFTINRMVDNKAEKKAEKMLVDVLTKKIAKFLDIKQ